MKEKLPLFIPSNATTPMEAVMMQELLEKIEMLNICFELNLASLLHFPTRLSTYMPKIIIHEVINIIV